MLTIDLDKIKIKDGHTILDLGCGKGRHVHKLYYYKKCHVIGLDLSFDDLKVTYQGFETYPDITNDPNRHFNLMVGNALSLPFNDESFDQIICSEVLEHIPDYKKVISEIYRVAKKNAYIGISVPNRLPEKICWYLSDEYHNEPGGHIHIFKNKKLINNFKEKNFYYLSKSFRHGLHSPYWWLKCYVGVKNEKNFLVNLYKKFLEWDILNRPMITRILEKLFDPIMGKSVVLYFKKESK